jgi:hypothetical protein
MTIVAVLALASMAGLVAFPTSAYASGPIYTYRYELPAPIAKLHTCVGPRQRTLREPDLWHVGKRRIFRIGCPENAPNITLLPHRDDSGWLDNRNEVIPIAAARRQGPKETSTIGVIAANTLKDGYAEFGRQISVDATQFRRRNTELWAEILCDRFLFANRSDGLVSPISAAVRIDNLLPPVPIQP